MNILTVTMRLLLSYIDADLAGAVNINDEMKKLSQALLINVVPLNGKQYLSSLKKIYKIGLMIFYLE